MNANPFTLGHQYLVEKAASQLPKAGIDCVIVPRKQTLGRPVSASTVRQLLQKRDFQALKNLVPASTLDYFRSPEAVTVMDRIARAGNMVHY